MAIDVFALHTASVTDPARQAFSIVPHDSAELTVLPRAIYVGTGGTIVLRAVDSAGDVVLKNLFSGQLLDIRARFVRATGTTAADLVALV